MSASSARLLIFSILWACLVSGVKAQDNPNNAVPILGDLNDPGLQRAAEHGLIQIVNTQYIEGVTVTLTHAFADANRIVLWYTIEGIELPEGNVKGRFVEPALLRPDGSLFGTGAMSGGVTPLDLQNAPGDYLVTFDHAEDYPSDGFYHLLFRLQIGGTVWVLPDGFVPQPGPLPDVYRIDVTPVGPFEFDLVLPASSPIELSPNQRIESNNISMSLQSLRIAASQTNILLCYSLPDERDWQPEIIVSIDGVEGVSAGGSLLLQPGFSESEPCYDLKSPVFYQASSRHMTITVDKLRVGPSEWTPEITTRAQDRLHQQGIEVEFYFGANGAGYDVIQAPEEMDNADVGLAIYDALSEFYEGPWVFEIDLP